MSLTAANRLARICAYSANAPEWEQFVRIVSPVLALSARRVSEIWGDSSDATVSEIVQEVFLKLCEDDRRILREYTDCGNDSFLKLLRKIACTVGTDHFRHLQADKRGGRAALESSKRRLDVDEFADSRAAAALEWTSLVAQLDGLLLLHLEGVSQRDRNLFWLYYRHGLTAQAISRIPAIGLSQKGVESALVRLRRLLREMIVHGRPKSTFSRENSRISVNSNGFSAVIAMDTVKRR